MSDKQYVKLFENFEEPVLTPDQEEPNLDTLRPGKKAALARGDDVLTKEQYAACYLNAKARIGRGEDTRRQGDTSMTRSAMNLTKTNDEAEDWQSVSGPKLSVYLGLKPQTVAWNIRKFMMMLDGNMEGTATNALYPEIIDYFNEFESMPLSEVNAIAEEAIDKEGDDTLYQAYLDKQNAASAESTKKKNTNIAELGKEIRRTFMRLFDATKDQDKAARMTVSNLAKMHTMDKAAIITAAQKEFSKEPIIQKIWKKYK